MKRFIVILALAISGVAQAAPVTIDFDEFSVGYTGSCGGYSGCFQSQGYSLLAYMSGDSTGLNSIVTGANSSPALQTATTLRFELDYLYSSPIATVSLSRADGGAFALYSLDWLVGSPNNSAGVFSINGTTMSGGNIQYLASGSGGAPFSGQTTLGTGDWLNLQSVYISGVASNTFDQQVNLQVDNIVVSAVPIPAAVWLFVSALGLLGVQRRIRRR